MRLALVLLAVTVVAADAQPVLKDSTSKRCMNVTWMDPTAVCEGRVPNALGLMLMGAGGGAAVGGVGGFLVPTECIGNAERAATVGAFTGAAGGLLAGLLSPYTSARELRARVDREKEAAQRTPQPKPWSWGDVKPLVVVTGWVAAAGAVAGAEQGATRPSCRHGVVGSAATGAGVNAAGFTAGTAALLIGVRLLF